MSFNLPDTDRCCGGSGISETGLLQTRVGFKCSGYPEKININWILLDKCSTASVKINLDMALTVRD